MPENNSRILTLPTMALRGTVAIPGMTMTLEVDRPISIAAMNAAVNSDRMVFLCAQHDMSVEAPMQSDLLKTGTVCSVSQVIRGIGGNTVKCIIKALYRAELLRITSDIPCLWSNVRIVEDYPVDTADLQYIANIRNCVDLYREYIEETSFVGPEILFSISEEKNPGLVSDIIAGNMLLRFGDKEQLINELNPGKRIELLIGFIKRELAIHDIQHDIHSAANESLSQNQREYYLREQLKIIQNQLGNGESNEMDEYREKILGLHLEESIEKKLLKELDRLSKQPFGSSEGAVIRTYLDTVISLPWNNRTEDIVDVAYAAKVLDEDHYGLTKVKNRILEFLAVRQIAPQVKGAVICLVGPPGVGKTSIAMSLARATNRKLARLSLGGVHDEAEIRGHRKTYVGAMPGRIMTAVQQAGTMNPILVLDEIDKLGSDYRGDPSAALLEALDREQNYSFRDHFLEIPFDLSEVLFITTANTTDTIPRALLDRMEVIEIGSYTDEEKLQIAKNHLIPKQRKQHGLNGNQIRFTDDGIRRIIFLYTRESGLRQLEREIGSICRKAAKRIASGEAKAVRVRPKNLSEFLGPEKYKDNPLPSDDTIGLVHGLAWTSVGGEVLDVECAAIPGTGRIELTGNLGNVMKESCQAAVTYIRGNAERWGIDSEFYKKTDIHLHFPEGAVPKDGPSAGVAICLSVVSALSNRPVRHDVAMTGEITLRGRVLPIGGLREKSMAAYRMGIRNVFIPEDNVPDISELDETIRNNMEFHPVSSADQVLENALL